MSRQDATDLLLAEREGGVFLVRDSTTIMGDFVLCVRFNDLFFISLPFVVVFTCDFRRVLETRGKAHQEKNNRKAKQ